MRRNEFHGISTAALPPPRAHSLTALLFIFKPFAPSTMITINIKDLIQHCVLLVAVSFVHIFS